MPLAKRRARRRAANWLDVGVVVAVATGSAMGWLRAVLGDWGGRAYAPGDGQFQAWTIDWVQGALLGKHALWNASIFVPAPRSLAFSDHLIGVAVVLLPLRALGVGAAAQLNVAIVLGTVLNALAAYVLGRVVHGGRLAAIVAAVAYSVGPLPHVLSFHVHMLWRPGVPLAMAFVWILADRRSGDRTWSALPSDRVLGIALALVIGWQGLVSFYSAVFVGMATVLAVVVRARDVGWRGLVRIAAAVVAGAAGVAWTLPPYLANARDQPGFKRTLSDTTLYRGRLFAAESTNSVWGNILPSEGYLTNHGLPVFAGVTVWLLAVLGVATAWRGRRRPDGRRSWAAGRLGLVIVGVSGVLALGSGTGGIARWTPFGTLFQLVPGFSVIRAPGRFWALGLVGLAMLAGLGASRLADALAGRLRSADRLASRLRTADRRRVPAAAAVGLVALVALVIEGLATPWPPGDMRPTHIDRALADRTDDGAVLYLPMGNSNLLLVQASADIVARSMAHDHPILDGYSGFFPKSAEVLTTRFDSLPAPRALACLAATHTRYVVVTRDVRLSLPVSQLVNPAQAAPLLLIERSRDELLYKVPDSVLDSPGTSCEFPGPLTRGRR